MSFRGVRATDMLGAAGESTARDEGILKTLDGSLEIGPADSANSGGMTQRETKSAFERQQVWLVVDAACQRRVVEVAGRSPLLWVMVP